MQDTKRMTDAYCDLLMEYAAKDPRIVVIENDLSHANGTHRFPELFPDRYFNVGIAESNSICIAAGMAANGFIPFVASLVPFITRRCYDQITLSVAYSKQNVKIVGTRPGVVTEQNGGTHFSISDVSLMRNLPGMTVVTASDVTALTKLFPQVLNLPTAVYLRFCSTTRKIYDDDAEIVLGKASLVRPGRDCTIIANDNPMLDYALQCADELQKEGVEIEIVDMHTIKPLDTEAVLRAAAKGPILTAENHSIINGLGSAVSEVLAENTCGCKFKRLGFKDRFGVVGWKKDISEEMEVSPAHITAAVRELLA